MKKEVKETVKSRRSKFLKYAISIIIAVILIYILLSQITFIDLKDAFSNLSTKVLFLAFVLYLVGYFFRALRFKIILNHQLSLSTLVNIAMIHNFIAQLLPARTGELSFVYLAKQKGIKGAQAAAAIIIARVFDIIAISCFFLISTLFLTQIPSVVKQFVIAVAVLLFVMIISIVLMIIYGDKVMSYLRMKLKRILKNRIALYVFDKVEEIISSFHVLKSKKIIILLLLNSIFLWFSLYLLSYLIFVDIAGFLAIPLFTVALSFSVLVNIIPIQSIGNFGTMEAFWTIAFVGLGVSMETAIVTGLVNHIVQFVFMIILAVIAFLISAKSAKD